MPLVTSAVGLELKPFSVVADARRLMAYAAGLGLSEDCYFDTTRAEGIVNHPLFPISPEWALITSRDSGIGGLGVTPAEAARGVHAYHDLHLHQPIAAGTRVTATARVTGVRRTRAGGLVTMRLDGYDGQTPLWSTWMGSLYRGVDVEGDDRTDEDPPAAPTFPTDSGEPSETVIDIATSAPHAYSECGQIWNPIHTDRAVARSAGLDNVILHGSATLAHGVNWALQLVEARPNQVRRLGASFRDTVPVPSSIRPSVVSVHTEENCTTVGFEVFNAAGIAAVRDAFVVIQSS